MPVMHLGWMLVAVQVTRDGFPVLFHDNLIWTQGSNGQGEEEVREGGAGEKEMGGSERGGEERESSWNIFLLCAIQQPFGWGSR